MPDRVIFHCDCNNYFASVELLHRPDLKEQAIAVCGDVDQRHGIILAKNEVAKGYGVKTAETVWQAKRKCPDLILLPPHREEYRKYSNIINNIYSEYTDRVEPFGIDESWLDMSGSWHLFGKSPKEVANAIRIRVRETTGLTLSVGVSYNKIIAKMGSDYNKPDKTTVIMQEDVERMLWSLPVTALLFVGGRAKEVLGEIGVKTIGDLARADAGLLKQLLGKHGLQLQQYALQNRRPAPF
ncbi:DNA polymerase IV [Ruminococcaceae bacterium OttesenSCG-928-I18]|nr:DNA polymerase IV [Ruminococcaceae bacterium OttesenSCG-928-I18]